MCRATVKQRGDVFTPGPSEHCHPAEPGTTVVHQIRGAVVEHALTNLFQPAGKIVAEVLREKLDTSAPHPSLPKPDHLARTANRQRQSQHPTEPADLDFTVDMDYVGDNFIQADICVGDKRHIVCAMPDMLGLPAKCKAWYIDFTFKVVRRPFTQLFSIYGFIRSGDCTKQVPMVYVIMSSRTKPDYKRVFRTIKDLLEGMKLKRIVMDFEYAMWRAVAKVFPDAEVKGCGFHWSQAVFRRLTDGLRAAYMHDNGTHKFVKKLLALPYIPADEIPSVFAELVRDTQLSSGLTSLTEYVRDNWVEGSRFPPSKWSVYKRAVRTNYDLEEYHHKLNANANKPNLPFYVLIDLIKTKCDDVKITKRLISDRKTKKIQWKQYRTIQGKVFGAWDRHEKGQITTQQLLSFCAYNATPFWVRQIADTI